MRLIDADALQRHFEDMQRYDLCAANFMDHRGEPSTNWYCVEDALENAPTIDAIPVEWLEEQADYARSEWDYDTCEGIRIVLKAWQKEQEAR